MFGFADKMEGSLERSLQKKIEPVIQRNFSGLEQSNEVRVFQTKRKVVYKEGDSIESSILWDYRQKKYYKNMKPRPNSQKYIYGRKMGNIKGGVDEAREKFDYIKQMYVDDSEKDRVGLKDVLFEYDENHFVEANKPDMLVYDGGIQMKEQEEPFSIRLYAEGNMDHALGLAAGMGAYLEQGKSDSLFPFDKMIHKKVLLKATEYRSLQEVAEAYSPRGDEDSSEMAAYYREVLRNKLGQQKNLEGSFGGKTGDMTRTVEGEELRKYDLIQATFFWIQGYKQDKIDSINKYRDKQIAKLNCEIAELKKGIRMCKKKDRAERNWKILIKRIQQEEIKNNASEACNDLYQEGNQESYRMMKEFVKHQLKKLKPTGEIRIVVSNINPYVEIKQELETEISTLKGDATEGNFYANVEIETKKLSKTYPQQLEEEGLNDVGFEQRQTKKMSTVTGKCDAQNITSDLLIIIRRNDNQLQKEEVDSE